MQKTTYKKQGSEIVTSTKIKSDQSSWIVSMQLKNEMFKAGRKLALIQGGDDDVYKCPAGVKTDKEVIQETERLNEALSLAMNNTSSEASELTKQHEAMKIEVDALNIKVKEAEQAAMKRKVALDNNKTTNNVSGIVKEVIIGAVEGVKYNQTSHETKSGVKYTTMQEASFKPIQQDTNAVTNHNDPFNKPKAKSPVYIINNEYYICYENGVCLLSQCKGNRASRSEAMPVRIMSGLGGGSKNSISNLPHKKMEQPKNLTAQEFDKIITGKPSLDSLLNVYTQFHQDAIIFDKSKALPVW